MCVALPVSAPCSEPRTRALLAVGWRAGRVFLATHALPQRLHSAAAHLECARYAGPARRTGAEAVGASVRRGGHLRDVPAAERAHAPAGVPGGDAGRGRLPVWGALRCGCLPRRRGISWCVLGVCAVATPRALSDAWCMLMLLGVAACLAGLLVSQETNAEQGRHAAPAPASSSNTSSGPWSPPRCRLWLLL